MLKRCEDFMRPDLIPGNQQCACTVAFVAFVHRSSGVVRWLISGQYMVLRIRGSASRENPLLATLDGLNAA